MVFSRGPHRRLETRAVQEDVLRRFFKGEIGTATLAVDLAGALVPKGEETTFHPIKDMDVEFEVQPEHLVRVCDAVLSGGLQPEHLKATGFCLVTSDHFH